MKTVQRSTVARLLRRALEVAVPFPSQDGGTGSLDGLVDRVLEALPKPRDATLVLRETEAEAERARFGDRRRRPYFDPYQELFACRRVTMTPWDKAWRRSALVLHDVELVHAFDILPHLVAEPYDHVEDMTKILDNHPGPVHSFRVDSSLFPRPEMLSRWMDTLSARGVTELVMMNVAAPRDVAAAVDFPVRRLRTPSLTRLALGFVTVSFGRCSGFLGLEALFLVCCGCSATDLSLAVGNLDKLKTLRIFGVDLAPAGAGAGHADDGVLEILSDTLSELEMRACKATAVILREAPSLQSMSAGVVSPGVSNPRVRWPSITNATPPVRIKVFRAEKLEDISGLVLWQQRLRILSHVPSNVHKLEASMEMRVSEQWTLLLDLMVQLPLLRILDLTRVDECWPDEELELQERPLPDCVRDSLQQLVLRRYRAGGCEIYLVTKVLATAQHLVTVSLYPHDSVDAAFAHIVFSNCPRLATDARVRSCVTYNSMKKTATCFVE